MARTARPVTKSIAALVAAAMLSVVAIVTTAPGASGSVGAAKTGKWAPGDCFKKADIEHDRIDLPSKVACSKKHAVQVFAGIELPDELADAGYAKLVNPNSAVRDEFFAFAEEACSRPRLVSFLYPTLESALAPLFLTHDITDFIPSAPGQMGWALADPASFKAGVKDVLCAFGIDQSVFGSTSGDIRKTETSAILPNFRMCRSRSTPTNFEFESCSKPHDEEAFIFLVMDVTGLPDDVNTWTEANYAPFDAACADFAKVLVGSSRTDLRVVADTSPDAPADNSRRLFGCTARAAEGNQFPPGTVVGLGDAEIVQVPKPTG